MAMIAAVGAEKIGQRANRMAHKIGLKGGAILLTAVVGIGIGIEKADANAPDKLTTRSLGHAVITHMDLEPGVYCNAKADGTVSNVSTRAESQALLHPWVQETLTSGPVEGQVCLKTNAIKHATHNADGTWTFNFSASSKSPSDLEMIVYPQDPTKMQFTPDSSNVAKFESVSLSDFNLIQGGNINPNSSVDDKLEAFDTLIAEDIISKTCGAKIVTALTATNRPGGNMQQQMLQDIVKNPANALGQDFDTSKISFHIANDGTGLPDEYDGLRQKLASENHSLSWPSDTNKNQSATCAFAPGVS